MREGIAGWPKGLAGWPEAPRFLGDGGTEGNGKGLEGSAARKVRRAKLGGRRRASGTGSAHCSTKRLASKWAALAAARPTLLPEPSSNTRK
eukprot:58613-Pleurochrysis_carterae.AAC.1